MIEIMFDKLKMAEIQKSMAEFPKALPRIVVKAIKKTVTYTKTQAARRIRNHIHLKNSTIKDRIVYLQRPTLDRWMAVLGISKKRIPIVEFSHQETYLGVAYSISNQVGFVKGAFLSTMKTGHKGAFVRKRHDEFDTDIHARRPWFAKLKGTPYRGPIKELYGPSLAAVFQNAMGVLQWTANDSRQYLETELDWMVTDYLLNRIRGGQSADREGSDETLKSINSAIDSQLSGRDALRMAGVI